MSFRVGDRIEVDDRMQHGDAYRLDAPTGADFAEGFAPFHTPAEMLETGGVEGKYCNDCRYCPGRRIGEIDARQIRRWRGFARHAGQIRANRHPGDVCRRPRQRRALLQWAYDPVI